VLLFGLFFLTLTAATVTAQVVGHTNSKVYVWCTYVLLVFEWAAVVLGVAGTIASAFIYLVPARPAWNMIHTPIDFLLSAGIIGSTLPAVLEKLAFQLASWHVTRFVPTNTEYPSWPVLLTAFLWLANQAIRLVRLNRSPLLENRASAALLNIEKLRGVLVVSGILVCSCAMFSLTGNYVISCIAAVGAVLCSRYLFFVSVVPLNMALTFARAGEL
jgi:DMSO reductase anchor subunit